MTIHTPTRSDDLAAIGNAVADDTAPLDIRLVVPGPIRRAGRGPIELILATCGLEVAGAELIWLVTTNKGWVHMRGEARRTDGIRLPFRADLFAAAYAHDLGPDRVAIRLYAPGDDPNRASPIHKLGGRMVAGSIRL